ncbi:MAG: helix-turn-helix domain-containing protein [Pseudohongiella sp.]|jgi:cytoskeleton protein RodZ|nr:helix-turn-helix domain-containing protein [Pseudohongiella sp.]
MPSEHLVVEDQQPEEASATLTVGDVLRLERERRGLSEKDVADKLHITMHYVKALETNAYEKLPGAVFAKGYIKNYALLLELEVDDLFSLYDEYNAQLQADRTEASRLRARKKTDRNRPWVILSLIAFVGGFSALWLYNNIFNDDSSSEPGATEINAVVPTTNQRQPVETAVNPLSIEPAVIGQVTLEPASSEVAEQISATAFGSSSLEEEESIIEQPAATGAQTAEQAQAADTEANSPTDIVPALTTLAANNRADSTPLQSDADVALEQQAIAAEASDAADVPRIIEVAAAGSDVLRIIFSGESWIEVNDSDSNQIYRDLRDGGDVLEITGSAPFVVLLGDAPFVSMTLNELEIDVANRIRIDNSARLIVGQ